MILASDLSVGSVIASVAERDGLPARGGVVIDANESTVFYLDDRQSASPLKVLCYSGGSRHPHTVRKAALRSMPIADVGEVFEIRGPDALHGWARAALLEVGLGNGLLGDHDFALIAAAQALLDESKVRRG